MLAHGYIPCNYNLHLLISILHKDNKWDEASIVHYLMLKKRKFESNRIQRFMNRLAGQMNSEKAGVQFTIAVIIVLVDYVQVIEHGAIPSEVNHLVSSGIQTSHCFTL